jgi:hypothetical protein
MFIQFAEGDTVVWMGQKYLVKYIFPGDQTCTLMDMYGAYVEADIQDCQVII